jgi:renalase
MTKLKNKKIAIIGAGISGLALANKLATLNEVVIFDKSRGIGGRMATRRVEGFNFDHGAQVFNAKTDEFKELCNQAKSDNIIEEWQGDFVEISENKIISKSKFNANNPRYVAKPQMNNLCKYMAKNLNILLGHEIKSVNFADDKWTLKATDNEEFKNFDYLFLAIPSNQAVNLIPKKSKYFDLVSNVKMLGCFTLMLGFEEKLNLEFNAATVSNSIISWISVNSSKPQRLGGFSLVINSSNEWADQNIEKDLELIKDQMLTSLSKIITFEESKITHQNIHRWKYAYANLRKGDKSLFDENLNLGICGDWLISGSVENAFLSAVDLYERL